MSIQEATQRRAPKPLTKSYSDGQVQFGKDHKTTKKAVETLDPNASYLTILRYFLGDKPDPKQAREAIKTIGTGVLSGDFRKVQYPIIAGANPLQQAFYENKVLSYLEMCTPFTPDNIVSFLLQKGLPPDAHAYPYFPKDDFFVSKLLWHQYALDGNFEMVQLFFEKIKPNLIEPISKEHPEITIFQLMAGPNLNGEAISRMQAVYLNIHKKITKEYLLPFLLHDIETLQPNDEQYLLKLGNLLHRSQDLTQQKKEVLDLAQEEYASTKKKIREFRILYRQAEKLKRLSTNKRTPGQKKTYDFLCFKLTEAISEAKAKKMWELHDDLTGHLPSHINGTYLSSDGALFPNSNLFRQTTHHPLPFIEILSASNRQVHLEPKQYIDYLKSGLTSGNQDWVYYSLAHLKPFNSRSDFNPFSICTPNTDKNLLEALLESGCSPNVEMQNTKKIEFFPSKFIWANMAARGELEMIKKFFDFGLDLRLYIDEETSTIFDLLTLNQGNHRELQEKMESLLQHLRQTLTPVNKAAALLYEASKLKCEDSSYLPRMTEIHRELNNESTYSPEILKEAQSLFKEYEFLCRDYYMRTLDIEKFEALLTKPTEQQDKVLEYLSMKLLSRLLDALKNGDVDALYTFFPYLPHAYYNEKVPDATVNELYTFYNYFCNRVITLMLRAIDQSNFSDLEKLLTILPDFELSKKVDVKSEQLPLLAYPIVQNNFRAVQLLIKYRADINFYPFLTLCTLNTNPAIIEILISSYITLDGHMRKPTVFAPYLWVNLLAVGCPAAKKFIEKGVNVHISIDGDSTLEETLSPSSPSLIALKNELFEKKEKLDKKFKKRVNTLSGEGTPSPRNKERKPYSKEWTLVDALKLVTDQIEGLLKLFEENPPQLEWLREKKSPKRVKKSSSRKFKSNKVRSSHNLESK